MPRESQQDVEARFYVNLNKWTNEHLLSIDPALTARIVNVDKEQGLQGIKMVEGQRNVILISSMSDPKMEWTVQISYDLEVLNGYLDAFEKDYRTYQTDKQKAEDGVTDPMAVQSEATDSPKLAS